MKKLALVVVVGSLFLGGCAAPIAGNGTYQAQETGVAQNVRFGIVESVRPVVLDKGTTGIGIAGGALVGGLLGSQIGGGWGSAAAAAAGAVAGGIGGQAIERNTSKSQGLEITVRLRDGRLIAVTQPADEAFYAGDRVRLVESGGRTRVTH